jgi:hypothetical protein
MGCVRTLRSRRDVDLDGHADLAGDPTLGGRPVPVVMAWCRRIRRSDAQLDDGARVHIVHGDVARGGYRTGMIE